MLRQVSKPTQLGAVVKSMLLPHGYPASVAPQFAPYMLWRGSQYFFGCALVPRAPPSPQAWYAMGGSQYVFGAPNGGDPCWIS